MVFEASLALRTRVLREAEPREVRAATTVLVTLEAVEATADEEADTRAPLDMVVVLDRSGSMSSRGKLDLCKDTISQLAGEMRERDRLGVVVYDTTVTVAQPITPMDEIGRNKLLERVRGIQCGSSTNLSGGLLEGIAELGRAPVVAEGADGRQRLRSVLLLTDGLANHGVTCADKLVPLTCEALASVGGAQLFTFGYGESHNEDLLQALAEAADGRYFFARNTDDVRGAFADCLGGLFSVTAQNIALRLTPGTKASFVGPPLTKMPCTQQAGGAFEVRISDMYAGEKRNVLLRVSLEPEDGGEQKEAAVVVSAEVSFADARAARLVTAAAQVQIRRVDEETLRASSPLPDDAEVLRQLTRWEVATGLEEATAAADKGDLAAARERAQGLRKHIARVKAQLAAQAGVEGAEDEDDVLASCAADAAAAEETLFADAQQYRAVGRRMAMQRAYEHGNERAVSNAGGESGPDSMSAYRTKAQSVMRSKWSKPAH